MLSLFCLDYKLHLESGRHKQNIPNNKNITFNMCLFYRDHIEFYIAKSTTTDNFSTMREPVFFHTTKATNSAWQRHRFIFVLRAKIPLFPNAFRPDKAPPRLCFYWLSEFWVILICMRIWRLNLTWKWIECLELFTNVSSSNLIP